MHYISTGKKILMILILDDVCFFQGVKFDPETGHILHIELARSNSRKRKSGSFKLKLYGLLIPLLTASPFMNTFCSLQGVGRML